MSGGTEGAKVLFRALERRFLLKSRGRVNLSRPLGRGQADLGAPRPLQAVFLGGASFFYSTRTSENFLGIGLIVGKSLKLSLTL